MKINLLGILILIAFSARASSVEHDFLAQTNLTFRTADPLKAFQRTADNPKSIFERYKPKLDSSSKITSPLQVGGTQRNPTLKLSVRKCVAFICQTVDLDAVVFIQQTSGSCKRNYAMYADLKRSSATLSDIYDRLDVSICYQELKSNEAQIQVAAHAHRAVSYSGGPLQGEIMSFLKLQVEPITQALAETLRASIALN